MAEWGGVSARLPSSPPIDLDPGFKASLPAPRTPDIMQETGAAGWRENESMQPAEASTRRPLSVVVTPCQMTPSTTPLPAFNPYNAEMERVFFQFEITINVLVSSFRFIWIPMSWVYAHFFFFQCGDSLQASESDVWRRQILTSKDGPCAERFKT